jgi:TolB-like protein
MRFSVATLLCLCAAVPAQAAPAGGKAKIAVTDIKTVQGVAQGTATILSDIVVSEVARAGYSVISQSDIDAMLGFEKKKAMLGCSEETSCLAEIGGALGVEYLVTGQVGKIGTRFRISLLVVDARRAVVVARAAEFTDADEDALARTSEEIVARLLKEVGALRQASAAAAAQRPVETKREPKTPVVAKAEPDLKPRPTGGAPELPAPSGGMSRGRKTGWWMVGGGGVLLLVGAGAGLQAKNELTKLEEAWQLDAQKYQDEYDSRSKAAKTLSIIADTSFVLGAASAGWGAWMLLRKEPGGVAVAPMALDGGAGLVAAGSF